MKSRGGDVAEKKEMVWVFCAGSADGGECDVNVFDSKEAAIADASIRCQHEWQGAIGADEPIPDNDNDIVERYFTLLENECWWSLEQLSICTMARNIKYDQEV